METSIFATATTTAKDVDYLVANANELCDADGIFQQSALPADFPIKYSRAWLIVRRAWLEANYPKAIKDATPTQASFASAKKKFGDQKGWEERHVYGPIVRSLRASLHSWGEIAVRCGIPESKVRTAFKTASKTDDDELGSKDLGQRIGRGGRYAYDDPTLYADHRQREGADIPADFKGRPKPEDLKNFQAPNAEGVEVSEAS